MFTYPNKHIHRLELLVSVQTAEHEACALPEFVAEEAVALCRFRWLGLVVKERKDN